MWKSIHPPLRHVCTKCPGRRPSLYYPPLCESISQQFSSWPNCHAPSKIGISRGIFSSSDSVSAVLKGYEDKDEGTELSSLDSQFPSATEPKIRQSLRFWQAASTGEVLFDSRSGELPRKGRFTNLLAPTEDILRSNEEVENNTTHDADQPIFEGGELVDFGNQRTFLVRGDLVELRVSGALGAELAIYVRQIGTQAQFYTISGKWCHQSSQLAKFYVPRFVESSELDKLLPFLPDEGIPETLQNKLQGFEHALPRDVGSSLINKMLQFRKDSDDSYRTAASKLDNAHHLLARESTMRYATLQEIAKDLLGKKFLTDGDYSAQMLYALHRSLVQDDIGFRVQQHGSHRTWGEFEISSIDDVKMVNLVTKEVRKYQDYLVASARGVKSAPPPTFLRFIAKARVLIDESRKTRVYTPFGTIGPLQPGERSRVDAGSEAPMLRAGAHLKDTDLPFVRFIESWAGFQLFGKKSYLHGIAATILRSIGRYEDTELDQSVGWTFLQEIGVIAPWENKVQFELRLSHSEGMRSSERKHVQIEKLVPDALSGLRKDWGDLAVYCIDDSNANEIDDGVSVEPTDDPGEYWIHVHVADPASRIIPRNPIALDAESMVRTIYLPEKVLTMLPSDITQEAFSLAPGRSSLTFSARLNGDGELLDYMVTPGTVRNVMYMTPSTVSEAIGENLSVEETVITVGHQDNSNAAKVKRPLIHTHEIREADKENLKILNRMGTARQLFTAARGAVTITNASFSSAVSFDAESISAKGNQPAHNQHRADPCIRLRADNWDVGKTQSCGSTVKDLMLLAGEVAARWCHARNIPIINRVTQFNPDQPDPREYFSRVILPIMHTTKVSRDIGGRLHETTGEGDPPQEREGIKTATMTPQSAESQPAIESSSIPLPMLREYMSLLGTILPSTTPGPHLALGVDMFTRATSPLRRYGDLVLHWQIEAALLEEDRRGSSLVGSKTVDYLPFAKDELDQLIPHLDGTERTITAAEKAADRFWAIQLLLRAWKHNEAALPATYEMVVGRAPTRHIKGELVSLGNLGVMMQQPGWIGREEILAGDVFEVKLINLNTYDRRIEVEPLRRIVKAERFVSG